MPTTDFRKQLFVLSPLGNFYIRDNPAGMSCRQLFADVLTEDDARISVRGYVSDGEIVAYVESDDGSLDAPLSDAQMAVLVLSLYEMPELRHHHFNTGVLREVTPGRWLVDKEHGILAAYVHDMLPLARSMLQAHLRDKKNNT